MFIQSSCRHFCSTGASGDHSWIIRRLHDLQQKRPIIDLNARSGWNRSWSAWQAGEAAKLLGQCKWQFLCDQIRNICKPYWNMKYVLRTGTQTPINSHGIPWFLSFRICSNYDMFVCFFKNSPLDPFSPSTSKRQSKSVPTIVQTPKCEHTFWTPQSVERRRWRLPDPGRVTLQVWNRVLRWWLCHGAVGNCCILGVPYILLGCFPENYCQVFWQIIAESVEFMFQNTVIITCRWEAFQQMFQSPQWKATVLQLREGLNEYSGWQQKATIFPEPCIAKMGGKQGCICIWIRICTTEGIDLLHVFAYV